MELMEFEIRSDILALPTHLIEYCHCANEIPARLNELTLLASKYT